MWNSPNWHLFCSTWFCAWKRSIWTFVMLTRLCASIPLIHEKFMLHRQSQCGSTTHYPWHCISSEMSKQQQNVFPLCSSDHILGTHRTCTCTFWQHKHLVTTSYRTVCKTSGNTKARLEIMKHLFDEFLHKPGHHSQWIDLTSSCMFIFSVLKNHTQLLIISFPHSQLHSPHRFTYGFHLVSYSLHLKGNNQKNFTVGRTFP